MKRGSEWLSEGAEILAGADEAGRPLVFDYVIVGSGYGGAIAAAKLSERLHEDGTPLTVCVLERGLEYLPGDFPSTFEELPAHVRYRRDEEPSKGFDDGLFDFKLAGDVAALVGSGLGGGSLINAGVAEEADARTLADAGWPTPWRSGPNWPQLYSRARARLGATTWPTIAAGKALAMDDIAASTSGFARPVCLTVSPPGADRAVGADATPSHPCQECGDCFSGCNVGAKLTLSHSYLRDAWRHGAKFFTGATVLRTLPTSDVASGHRWTVEFRLSDEKKLRGRSAPFMVRARSVVLSAGTFGSTEILFRSRSENLSLSPRLGERFSANGDTIGAQYGLERIVEGYADENTARESRRVGPTITHLIDLRSAGQENAAHGLVIENMTVPAPMAWLFGELLTSLMLPQRWTRADKSQRGETTPDPYVVDDGPDGAVHRTLLVATQGNDGAKGVLEPSFVAPGASEVAGVRVRWPDVGKLACFQASDDALASATPEGAHWLRNPMWQGVPDSPLLDVPSTRGVVTVHPLGGCAMSASWRDGVVDPFGRVYDAPKGASVESEHSPVHPGLYVLDGSIIPVSLGINPLLTISALAEGCVDEWIRSERHQSPTVAQLGKRLPPTHRKLPATARPVAVTPTAVVFHERMTGPVAGPAAWSRATTEVPLRLSMRCDFQKIDDLGAFVRQQRKHLTLSASFNVSVSNWRTDELRHQNISANGDELVLRTGNVYWFEQAASGWVRRTLRSARAWVAGRLRADLTGRFGYVLNRYSPGAFAPRAQSLAPGGMFATLRALFNALTHFGAPRLLRYDFGSLEADWILARDAAGRTLLSLPAGTRLHGAKSLVYVHKGNPWEQITNLELEADLPTGKTFTLARMKFDELFMLDRDRLPMTVTSQASGTRGVRDALSLALFFGRVIAGTHFPTFRAPDYAAHVPFKRLPQAYAPNESKYPELEFDQHRFSIPTRARDSIGQVDLMLTRLRRRTLGNERTPILMLHGFGASGSLFTHAKIRVPMAVYLAREHGRDVWVAELRTSIALESSHAQWTMDDVAQEDVPALIKEVLRLASADQVDVIAHCIGSAMFCMAALSGRVTGLIRHATLMQVGPVVHLPRTNRMRGYLGHRAQQLLGADTLDSTMDDRAGEADRLLDRVAGSYSYLAGRIPGSWQSRFLDSLPLGWTLRHNQRRLNVLRSATVFGQLFQWRNMDDPDLLDALPDLLGHCNLTTYQQTVYYAFARRLTNQAGQDVYVTDANVRSCMQFPLLFIQGDVNDTFDRRGTLDSARLLKRVHGPAHPVFRKSIEGYGHLDCVVGKDAPTLVYPAIASFLRDGSLAASEHDDLSLDEILRPLKYRQPVVGPWLGHAARDADGNLDLRLGLKVDDQRTPPPWIVSMLVLDGRLLPESIVFHETPVGGSTPPWAATAKACQVWPEGEATIQVKVQASMLDKVTHRIQVRLCTPFFDGPVVWPERAEFVREWCNERRSVAAHAGVRGLAHRDRDRVDQVTLRKQWLVQSEKGAITRFILGSCRQTPLLLDRDLADAAFGKILRTELGTRSHIDHVLLVGDQIYADAMASVESVRGTKARFVDAHREAWTAPHQRDLMRRIPTYMAVDDHEFTDNYCDTTVADFPMEFSEARDAWWRYQLAAGPAGLRVSNEQYAGAAWYPFTSAGFEYFVCDTRSERTDGGRIDRGGAKIMKDAQKHALERWLRATRRKDSKPRFIVLPSHCFPGTRRQQPAPNMPFEATRGSGFRSASTGCWN
jgi:choline dehydrogenase-like flavoprotein